MSFDGLVNEEMNRVFVFGVLGLIVAFVLAGVVWRAPKVHVPKSAFVFKFQKSWNGSIALSFPRSKEVPKIDFNVSTADEFFSTLM
jgi:hypothetical protein